MKKHTITYEKQKTNKRGGRRGEKAGTRELHPVKRTLLALALIEKVRLLGLMLQVDLLLVFIAPHQDFLLSDIPYKRHVAETL